jgi:PAS domain S-box-containing protein
MAPDALSETKVFVHVSGDCRRCNRLEAAVLPICAEQEFLAELKREGYTCDMLILSNRIQRLTFFGVFCVAWFNAYAGRPVEALSAPKKTVLVLYGDPLSAPADRMTEQGLTVALSSAHGWNLEVFSEYLDLMRFPAAQYGDDIVRFLRARHETRKPDVLITLANTTLQFVLDHRDDLFPGVPIVFANVDHREVEGKEMPPNITGLWMAWDYQRTLELALQLQSKTREVVCVSGTGVEEQAWNKEARKVLERFASQVRTRWLDKLPLQAVLDEVAELPPDSVVLYIPMQRDGAGQSVSPFEVARQLAEASRVPVYGLSLPQLQQGIIGGALLDFSEIGHKTAALAFRVLAGERPPTLSPPDPSTNPLLINWRALKKWHVSESRIPAEATVLYRDPSLWEKHPRLILATAAVVGLQSVLIVGLILQRSRRKRAEESLRDSEDRMSLAAEAANLGMWVWDVVKDEIWMTDKGRALFGIAPDTRLDYAALVARVHPEDRAARDAAIRRALETHGEYAMEHRVVLSDGQVRWIAGRGRADFGDGKPLRMRGVSRDCTAQKQADQETLLLRQEIAHVGRVSMMGQLASALAHEINQPLGAILRNTEAAELFTENESPDLDEIRAILADIRKDDQRAGSVIDRMRALLKRHDLETRPLDLGELVGDVASLARADAAARQVKLDVDVPGGLPLVRGDRVHLQQVLLNLILNGMDALNEVSRQERHVSVTARLDGAQTVEIAVSDTGHGIPADKLAHVFDPFFTTKPNGIGMGLPISRTIIEAHGGRLWAENNNGGGAAFRFTLPIAEEAAAG